MKCLKRENFWAKKCWEIFFLEKLYKNWNPWKLQKKIFLKINTKNIKKKKIKIKTIKIWTKNIVTTANDDDLFFFFEIQSRLPEIRRNKNRNLNKSQKLNFRSYIVIIFPLFLLLQSSPPSLLLPPPPKKCVKQRLLLHIFYLFNSDKQRRLHALLFLLPPSLIPFYSPSSFTP